MSLCKALMRPHWLPSFKEDALQLEQVHRKNTKGLVIGYLCSVIKTFKMGAFTH